ncbi:MAG TPA: pseudouridine synthase [Rhodocyclaceae bacterium]|nr:pseudouridine synthase [Rhodocyclaceae bacterium]
MISASADFSPRPQAGEGPGERENSNHVPKAGTAFHLLYADAHLLVLDKPAGLLAVPGRGEDKQDCLSARVQAVYPDALIVHRLDMATSGLLVMARGAAAQSILSKAFAQRQVSKRYIAVVAGHLPLPATPDGWGLIDLPLIVDWPNRPRSIVDRVQGKPSQTRWRVVGNFSPSPALPRTPPPLAGEGLGEREIFPTTRLELAPLTGRSHQLRVHLQALGHPILGDTLYAPPEVQALADRLLLHASEIAFTHPASGEGLRFVSPAPF